VPVAASALVDFQLVPDQQPDAVLTLLQKHLAERGCGDIVVEALPGSYAPIRSSVEHPFIQHLLSSGERIYGEPPGLLPIGAFVQPLHILADRLGMPVAALALARQNSAIYGPNERLPLEDLVRHAHILAELLLTYSSQPAQVEVPS
jgi:acetylornithine deacetylase/succinyl-diaminopimelate desuccinylase-like protein